MAFIMFQAGHCDYAGHLEVKVEEEVDLEVVEEENLIVGGVGIERDVPASHVTADDPSALLPPWLLARHEFTMHHTWA